MLCHQFIFHDLLHWIVKKIHFKVWKVIHNQSLFQFEYFYADNKVTYSYVWSVMWRHILELRHEIQNNFLFWYLSFKYIKEYTIQKINIGWTPSRNNCLYQMCSWAWNKLNYDIYHIYSYRSRATRMNVAKVTSVKNRMSETIIIVKCLLNMKYILLAAKKENAVL